jgi:hypothetical protein
MLSMNGIIILELILGGVLMSLIFTSFANTDLIADPSSKPKQEPESDSIGATMKPGRARKLGDQIRAFCSCVLVHSPIMFTGFPVLLMTGSGHANGPL